MDSNVNIAWTRTTFTALWTGFVIWVSAKLGWELNPENPVSILLVGLAGGAVWRLSELISKIPYLGYILFGINKEPGYDTPPPANPVTPKPAPEG